MTPDDKNHPINAPHSPLEVKMVMAIYVSRSPNQIIGDPTWGSPAGKDARKWALGNDLIVESMADDQAYEITDRGLVWLNAILSVPLPQQEWVIK